MRKFKIFVVGGDLSYLSFLTVPYTVVERENADLFLFTGGEDVYPSTYGQDAHPKTFYNIKRDIAEFDDFCYAYKNKIAMIGICRGAQFLTVMNGGYLIQNVCNHANGSMHYITIINEPNRKFKITSTHHQMMYPYNLPERDYTLIAKSSERLSNKYEFSGENDFITEIDEPEIVYYNKTNALCIQGHPEMMSKSSEAVLFINQLIKEFFDDEIIFSKSESAEYTINRILMYGIFDDKKTSKLKVKPRYAMYDDVAINEPAPIDVNENNIL